MFNDFFREHPKVDVELQLINRHVDPVVEGLDFVISGPPVTYDGVDDFKRLVYASLAYLARHGEPAHPSELATHRCLRYSYLDFGAHGGARCMRVRVCTKSVRMRGFAPPRHFDDACRRRRPDEGCEVNRLRRAQEHGKCPLATAPRSQSRARLQPPSRFFPANRTAPWNQLIPAPAGFLLCAANCLPVSRRRSRSCPSASPSHSSRI